MRATCPEGALLSKRGKIFLNLFSAFLLFAFSCRSSLEKPVTSAGDQIESPYIIYLVNNGLHTGLIIPVNHSTKNKIIAVNIFSGMEYVDFGWGEEEYYQHPGRKYCMGIKAVAVPNTSVLRVQGFSAILEDVINWSDYTVQFNLTESEFDRLCRYIEGSFSKDENGGLMETSRRRNGEIIYFKSVYYYHGLNTCNTWAARGLREAGLDVSSFFVITAGDLLDAVKGEGIVLKVR